MNKKVGSSFLFPLLGTHDNWTVFVRLQQSSHILLISWLLSNYQLDSL